MPRSPELPAPVHVNVGGAERLVSSALGGAMALYGLSRRSLSGLAVAGIGGALLARGVRGHCPAYRALGTSTAAVPAPVEIVQPVSVRAPAGALGATWLDPLAAA